MVVLRRIGWGVLGLAAVVYVMNASWRAPSPTGELTIIAHRGVAQDYHREGLTNETCTAERIDPPTHPFLENTIPSIAEAFRLGADVVEIDIHPTTDGEFAVFHDWTIDCRTEGTGRTRDQSMELLRTLDIGYGYTADGGETYPFRGKAIGMMPTLGEVLEVFPGRAFLINDKANRSGDAVLLSAYLDARPYAEPKRLSIVTGPRFASAWRDLRTDVPVGTRAEAKACAKGYLAWGWVGHVPESCAYGIGVPLDLRRVYWGWPNRLQARFADTPGGVMVTGPLKNMGSGVTGVDSAEMLDQLPDDFSGAIVTDKIEVVGPALGREEPRDGD
ncbi:MAG: glycerophosphodiester phosphodiesterase family protein [Pseudomonadota bacterium]